MIRVKTDLDKLLRVWHDRQAIKEISGLFSQVRERDLFVLLHVPAESIMAPHWWRAFYRLLFSRRYGYECLIVAAMHKLSEQPKLQCIRRLHI